MRKGLISKKSQITIFVIVAVIIIVGIIGVVLFRNVLFPSAIPSDLVPVYDYYLSCVSNIADDGITIMGSHAGYIEPPTFEPGSQYAPFSSMLGFMGTVIGMIAAFANIEAMGDISPTIVASGIKVALLTTVFGLIVAIILQIFYNYIVSKVDSLVNAMEDSTISFVDILAKYKK